MTGRQRGADLFLHGGAKPGPAATGARSRPAVDLGRGVHHPSPRSVHIRQCRARRGLTGAGTARWLCVENRASRAAVALASGGRSGRSHRLSENIARASRASATSAGGGSASREWARGAHRARGNRSNL